MTNTNSFPEKGAFGRAQLAGLEEIPAFIRVADDQAMLEMALVENIQRENLDAIEVAISYKRLMEECKLTQEALSEKVSKKRATIANYLRLLRLPADIQLAIRNRDLTMGHARALVNIDDQDQQMAIFNQVLDEELSVRQTEELVRGSNPEKKASKSSSSRSGELILTPEQQKSRERLTELLGTRIDMKRDQHGRGKIIIPFSSDNELQRLLDLLNG